MTRVRIRAEVPPAPVEEDWPNGAAIYREGTGHLKSDVGLMGYAFREDGKQTVAAWAYKGKGKTEFLGQFPDHEGAMKAVKWNCKRA